MNDNFFEASSVRNYGRKLPMRIKTCKVPPKKIEKKTRELKLKANPFSKAKQQNFGRISKEPLVTIPIFKKEKTDYKYIKDQFNFLLEYVGLIENSLFKENGKEIDDLCEKINMTNYQCILYLKKMKSDE